MQQTDIDLRDVISILRRQRRLILLTGAIILGLALAYLLSATPIYRATALVQIDVGGSNLLDPHAGANQQSQILNSRVDSEVEILRSAATSLAVIERGNLLADPQFGPQLGLIEKFGQAIGVNLTRDGIRRAFGLTSNAPNGSQLVSGTLAQLQSATDIRRRGLTYLISVSVSSKNPAAAARLANLTAATYIDRQVEAKTTATIAARDVLQRQLNNARADLAQSEESLNNFIEDNLARLEAESGNASVAALRRQLESAQQDRLSSVTAVQTIQTAAARGDWAGLAASLEDQALAALEQQRSVLARQLAGAAQGSIQEVNLRDAVAAIEQSLAEQANTLVGSLQTDIRSLEDQQETARNSLREVLLQSDLSSDLLADLFNLQQSATVARNQYQQLLSRVQDVGTLANLQIADARIVSEALAPTSAASPNKRLVLAVAFVGAIGLGVGLAFLNEYYIGGVTSASQLRNILQANVPVTISSLTPSKDVRAFSDQIVTAPLSVYAESFRKLRSAIDISFRDQNAVSEGEDPAAAAAATPRSRVILVCSALPAEGKSTSALALARTYAASGIDTLLIDGDLRKPSLHGYLGVESETGLLSFLRDTGTDPETTLHPIRDPLGSLTVITAGPRSNEPTDQLLGGKSFSYLIKAAKREFGVIIFDSPPLLPVVDARYLAQHADAVVLVVRYATTTQGEVREAASQVQEMMRPGAALIGLLSHEVRAHKKSNYYSNRYYASAYNREA